MNWWSKLFSEVDNQTPDFAKYAAAALGGAGILAQLVSVAQGHEFHAQDFFLGAGGYLAGLGAVLKLKKESGVPFNPPAPPAEVNAAVAVIKE